MGRHRQIHRDEDGGGRDTATWPSKLDPHSLPSRMQCKSLALRASGQPIMPSDSCLDPILVPSLAASGHWAGASATRPGASPTAHASGCWLRGLTCCPPRPRSGRHH